MDDELLQDYLVEAGELIEGIDVQLVALEAAPDDSAALNGVFRTFHTIKGGAGFLALEPLVAICHSAEEVLNAIRAGERALDANVMDLVLQSVDEVKRMFAEVAGGKALLEAPESLLTALDALLAAPPSAAAEPPAGAGTAMEDRAGRGAAAAGSEPSACVEDDPVLADFERLLASADSPAEITEDEFDALLDAIQAENGSDARGAASAVDTGRTHATAAATAAATPADEPSRPPPPAGPSANAEPSNASAEPSNANAEPSDANGAAGRNVEHTLRVDAARVDAIMNLVGELVLVRNRVAALRDRVQDEDVHRAMSQLNLVTSDLQASVMRLRMQPVGKAFGRFPRVVRDLTRKLGKEAELEMEGASTELDKGMVESLADPLIHLVRNAIDHGLEMPAERERAGKPARGRLLLAAHQEGSHIFVTVADDGAGLDAAAIKQKALDKGLIDPRTALQMADDDALNLIFMPGFSTRSAVSDISGRGVGLDVVKSQISRINGTVDIHSEKGRGTRVVLRLPLTLAILPALMVSVGRHRLALPLPVVEEIVEFDPAQCASMDGREVLSLRGDVLPLLDLERWVGPGNDLAGHSGGGDDGDEGDDGEAVGSRLASGSSVVVASAGPRRVALLVQRLIGQEEVVIKPLGARLEGLPGFGGATITGDGRIALIVDVGSLVAHWQRLAAYPGRSIQEPPAAAPSGKAQG